MKISLSSPQDGNGIEEILVDHFPFVLGRDSQNDCQLKFAFISRQHCQFTQQDDTVVLQDLESHNGTYINGRRLAHPTVVQDGDEVSIGPICLRVKAVRPTAETTPECLVETRPIPPRTAPADQTAIPHKHQTAQS